MDKESVYYGFIVILLEFSHFQRIEFFGGSYLNYLFRFNTKCANEINKIIDLIH